MVESIFLRKVYLLGKNNCESSIPKSVKSPVKWVVLTTALEILVTNEFCTPIAKSNKQAMTSILFTNEKREMTTTVNNTIASNSDGKTKILSFLVFTTNSINKPDAKDPAKKEII